MWELTTRQRPYKGAHRFLAQRFEPLELQLTQMAAFSGFGRNEIVERMGPAIVPIWAAQGQRPRWPTVDAQPAVYCPPEWRVLAEQCWAQDPFARPIFSAITARLRDFRPVSKGWQSSGSK